MKKLFFNAIALMVLVSPLLMAMKCTPPPEFVNEDENCEIDCEVLVTYVDGNGQIIKFKEGEFKSWNFQRAECVYWVDLQTQSSLHQHNDMHNYHPNPSPDYSTWHARIFVAPARDSLTHPKVKAKLHTTLVSTDEGKYEAAYLYDDIEVELNYTTPDKASIDLIKINGEVKWDRSKATEEELSEVISIEVYLDKERLKEFM